MKKTYSEILEILKDKLDSVYDFANEDYDEQDIELGEINEVFQEGGENEGSHWESVKYFVEHDIYIRVIGSYSSYNGVNFYNGWHSCSEVRPFEKIITIYKNI